MMREHLGFVARTFMYYMAVWPTFGATEEEWAHWSVNRALVSASGLSGKCGPKWLILTGRQDEVVSPHASNVLSESLEMLGCTVTRSTFEGGHSCAGFGTEGDKVLPAVVGFFGLGGGSGARAPAPDTAGEGGRA